jgi:hypothetical protein
MSVGRCRSAGRHGARLQRVTDTALRHVRAGAATAIAQVLVMTGSSLLGLLIARRLGSSGATDGFFAANAVYGIALFTAQSLRTTAPSTLLDPGGQTFVRHLKAVGLIAVMILLLFGAVAAFAGVVASDAAASTLRVALAVLAPAAVAQLFAGLLAARCAVLGEFGRPAAVYAFGTLGMAGAFVLLVGPLGVDAIAVAVALGAIASALLMTVVWRSAEHRAAASPLSGSESTYDTAPRLIGHLLRGALPVLASQVAITVSVFSAGHIAPGDGTLYSYGTLAVAVLVAIVASPVSIVLAPEIARTWDRRPTTLVGPTMASYRLGALLLPLLAIPGLLIGPEVAEWLLTALSSADIETVAIVAAVMVPSVLVVLLAMVPLVGAVAGGLLGRVGVGVALVVLIHVPLAAAAAASGSLVVLAAEGALASIALSAVPVAAALSGVLGPLLRSVTTVTAYYVLPGCVAALLAWWGLGAGTDLGPNALAALVGISVHVVVALTLGRDDIRVVVPARFGRSVS